MDKKKWRVVVIGTGNVGSITCRCLQGRDDVELVGVWAHRETAGDQVGLDAGLLDGNVPSGVIVTDSEDEIFALKPDCAVMVINIRNLEEAKEIDGRWYIKFLENGINVVTPSIPGLAWPRGFDDKEFVTRIEAAAKKGDATIYMNGQEPGVTEHLAMLLATCSNTIKSITSYELFNYSTTPSRDEMALYHGFDEPPDYSAILEMEGIQQMVWGPTIAHVANRLGYEVDSYKEIYEKRVTEKDIPVAWGTIKAGKVAAVRIRTVGVVEGRDAVVIEHVNRMCTDIAPEWESSPRAGALRIKIEGDPNLSLDFAVGLPEKPSELAYDGYVMTAMRIVNAIPYVCAAPAGIATVLDLPLTLPSSAFRSDATFIDHKRCRAAKA
jgi:2,4-diaminopentanoate dehydrogenase